PHRRRVLEVGRGAGVGPPVVALHAAAVAGDQGAGNAVAGAVLVADEAVAVGVDVQAFVAADLCALGVADARIGVAPGLFAVAADRDRVLGGEAPRMP